jgi:hypothetical protein
LLHCDYYLKPEERFQKARAEYLVYVANTLSLLGSATPMLGTPPPQLCNSRLNWPRVTKQSRPPRPQAVDHKTKFAELQTTAPRFDWTLTGGSAGLERTS